MKIRIQLLNFILLFTVFSTQNACVQPESKTAHDVENAFVELAKESNYWPAFEPTLIPLAIFDGNQTYLFRHPNPPDGFKEIEAGVYTHPGRFASISANSSVPIGDIETATLLLKPLAVSSSLQEIAGIALHEAFHVFQNNHYPHWGGNEADLFTYPSDRVDLYEKRRLESAALKKAIDSEQESISKCWIEMALTYREERFQLMDSIHVAYERGTELLEGLASYVEASAVASKRIMLKKDLSTGFLPQEIRQRGYVTGATLALSLDRFSPGWQNLIDPVNTTTLENLLMEKIPQTANESLCSLSSSEIESVKASAQERISQLIAERAQLLSDFEVKPGWQVIVETAPNQPFWPKGFDPLNVALVDDGVLHTRFLQIGNESGSVEVMGQESFTEQAGDHPLFNGIRLFKITGFTEKPKIENQGGQVVIETTTFKTNLSNAEVSESDQIVHIKLLN